MEMLGIRSQGRNTTRRPNKLRKGHCVRNRAGDLDAYIVQYDHPERFASSDTRLLWDAISARMHILLPSATKQLVSQLDGSAVRERLYSAGAIATTSHDLAVNNIGVSSAYQSPAHVDKSDVGWTFAFACKCEY